SGCAFVAATLIMFGAVLPVEFNWDPLRLGQMSGLNRLWAPSEVAFDTSKSEAPLAREYPQGFRADVIEIPLRAGGDSTRGDELEYKVQMKKDATFIYEWSVAEIPKLDEFYFDFHGHTVEAGKAMTVATYKQATGTSANGALRRRARLVFPEPVGKRRGRAPEDQRLLRSYPAGRYRQRGGHHRKRAGRQGIRRAVRS